jgi:hypothetical protein
LPGGLPEIFSFLVAVAATLLPCRPFEWKSFELTSTLPSYPSFDPV